MEKTSSTDPIVWNISFPLLTSRFFIYDMFKLTLGTFTVMGVILSAIVCSEGNVAQVEAMLKIAGIVSIALLVTYAIVSLLWFGNCCDSSFRVSSRGVSTELLSKRNRVVNRTLVVLGLLSGNPRIAGTGLIAMTGESSGVKWDSVYRIKEYPSERVITIMDSWHVVLRLYCTQENYVQVAESVRAFAAKGKTERESKKTSAGPARFSKRFLPSGLAFFASLALLASPFPFEVKPFFAAAFFVSVLLGFWIPPWKRFFGLLALSELGLIGGLVIREGFRKISVHVFKISNVEFQETGRHFSNQTMDTGDWLRLLLAGAGFVILGFLAARSVLTSAAARGPRRSGRKQK